MNVIKYMRSIIQDKKMRYYYNRSPRFRDYVDRCVRNDRVTTEEVLRRALVREVAKYYKDQDAMETGRHPKNSSTYTPMGECV